uniref:ATP binding cassette subfamily A member 12 n=1 Tax=Lepisosteus oculatus TaxID=7918 RepID=W5MAB7_LEPOC
MATFLQQLRLLLWKNCLSVVRQPVWSLVLLIWPLVIFIILAVTRSQFPPVQKSTCYAAPRNLPSAGFFPFLQTLLCNSDSVCANKSYLLVDCSTQYSSFEKWYFTFYSPHLYSCNFQKPPHHRTVGIFPFTQMNCSDPVIYIKYSKYLVWLFMERLSLVSSDSEQYRLMNSCVNDGQAVSETLSSADFLKRLICNHTLPLLFPSGDSSSSPLSYGLLTFCQSKDTLLEAAIVTLNHVLSDLALKNPGEMLLIVGEVLGGFETLQGEAPLWDFLLGLPQLFQPEQSPEQSLSRVVALLGSITRVLDRIQKDFLQANPVLSYANHTLGQTISILQYVLNWPGKGSPIIASLTVPHCDSTVCFSSLESPALLIIAQGYDSASLILKLALLSTVLYCLKMSNQSFSDVWVGTILNSTTESILKVGRNALHRLELDLLQQLCGLGRHHHEQFRLYMRQQFQKCILFPLANLGFHHQLPCLMSIANSKEDILKTGYKFAPYILYFKRIGNTTYTQSLYFISGSFIYLYYCTGISRRLLQVLVDTVGEALCNCFALIKTHQCVTVYKFKPNNTALEILNLQKEMNPSVQEELLIRPCNVISDMLLTVVPNNSIHMLAWLTNLQYCSDPAQLGLNQSEELVFRTFCTFSPVQWYNFAVVVLHNLDLETVIYRVLMSSDMQNTVGVMMQLLKAFLGLMNKLLPQLQVLMQYLRSVQQLNLIANPEFRALSSGTRSFISSRATFATLSQAMCTNGMLALFGISEVPNVDESQPSTQGNLKREQLIDKFNIPRNATPFCMGLYLDMVNTTGGAVAWAFLKPMLLGKILYTPDTPETAAIMKKSNATLQQFADLKVYAEEWIKSSSYVQDAVQVLEKTLPILQNSLNNTFVQNFIRLQANIDVNEMKQTLQGLSNVSAQLQKNSNVLKQMTTLSQLMLNLSSCVSFDRFQALNSTAELNSLALDLTQTRDHYASVVFKLQKNPGRRKRSLDTGLPLPPLVAYTIRMSIENTMRTDRTRDLLWARDSYISPTRNQRHTRGFVYLQESIDRAIMELQTGRSVEEPAVQLQPFPYPCYNKDDYLQSISYAFPLVLMIAWVLFVANFVKKLVHERELRLHEYMKMMGVNPASHFFAWFLEGAAFLLITIIFLTIILKAGGILPSSDGFILFLYLCDYGLSILAISFLVSSFFDQTNIAGLSGSLIYVIFFFPFIVVMSLEQNLSFSTKTLLGLFSPTCFSYASQYIARYEEQGVGLQWNNSYTSPLSGDTSSFGWMCWLLLIDSLLYFIMGWYIRIVFPGKYGIAAPWYFPVLPSFWADRCGCGGRSPTQGRGLFFANVMRQNQGIFPKDKVQYGDVYVSEAESEFAGLPVGVALHGLTKTYGSRTAIRNLNLQFYEGQVTALLGHNGAGKTTTMSLLTGLFGPSSGSIVVYGKDMQTYIKEVRRDLGVCMQYDVHFDHLTAKEHLLLYGSIKAPHWSKAELYQQVKKTLQETGMYAHRHKRVGTLSGGMKRKLSISIAFIAGSRLVVLDEPTSGVDPCSRRSIWDIVIQNKTERTIILSTHHLDEAEVLSDRIAFLERGGLKCCGSPFFLKDKLGKGYSLTLTKKAETPGSDAGFNSEEVSAFIKSHLPEAWLKEGEVGDVVYSLPPFSSQNAEDYRSLLTSLDKNLDTLQLGCYGISDTTLEEVFLQLTGDEEEESRAWSRTKRVIDLAAESDGMPEETTSSSYTVSDKEALTGSASVEGLALIGQCVLAMLIKRLHHSRRNWKGLISQILLPVLFVIAAMGLGTIKSNLQDFPELRLSPALYPDGQQYAFFSNDNPSSSPLVNTMMSFPGIDNVCLENPASQYCLKDSQLGDWTRSGNMSLPNGICECTSTVQTCPRFNFEPPSKRNPSSQIVYNLTNVNIEKYLLLTANNFIQDRYGGWSFGASLPTDLRMDMVQKPQNRTLTKVWYNPEGYHTMPAFLNSLNNFILRTNLPSDVDPKKYGITVFSHPYPGQVQNDDVILRNLVNTLVALCILLGYSIMTASFVVYEVQEHHSGAKRLQHISGIGEPFYWIVNFFYDMTLYLFPVAVSVAVIAAFQLPAFNSQYNLGAVSLLLVLFGLATFPWMYLLAGTFKDTEMAFISYVCINLFIAVNTIISTSVVYFLMQINQKHSEDIQRVYDVLSSVFLIFPQFSFGNGLMELSRLQMEVEMLALYGVDAYKNPFRMDVLGWIFVSMAIQFVVFSALRLLLNTWLLRKIRSLLCRRSVPDLLERDEDEDVVAERHRVESQGASSDVLQVSQLNKVYQNLSKKVHAVRRLSVGIPAGECFGLLGVNGAGKTTTFKILTGEIMPTDGAVHIRDQSGRLVNVADSYNEGLKIGYCPQVDALDFLLTAEEHLYFYARIRGISSHHISRVVSHLLQKLELAPHKDVTSERYSCGMRRKLSTAIALIGRPQILLLDEPSSGMDPKSKRHLWKIISEEVKAKTAVVLTSHSMEECEAVCTRLAIMVKGQFKCLGSLQHIKSRFGSGFTVKMYLSVGMHDVDLITNFMQIHFPSTYMKDQHLGMVEYHVPVVSGGVADIFDKLETNKEALHIKHFSVSQTTLDEVFINFAMGKTNKRSSNGSETETTDPTVLVNI